MCWSSDSFDFIVVIFHTLRVITPILFTELVNFFLIGWRDELSHNFFGNVPTYIFFVIFLLFPSDFRSCFFCSFIISEFWNLQSLFTYLYFFYFRNCWELSLNKINMFLFWTIELRNKHVVWNSSDEGWNIEFEFMVIENIELAHF